MKKAKYYLLLALVVIMSGCDDFLEKNPPSKPSENTFWKQKSDLDMALTACYGTMTKFSHGYFSFGTPQWDSFVDNCHSVGEGITFDVFQGNIDPSAVGINKDVYKGKRKKLIHCVQIFPIVKITVLYANCAFLFFFIKIYLLNFFY